MKDYFKSWRVRLLALIVVFSVLVIAFNGLDLGIDFKGGTLFQIHLAEKASPEELQVIASVIASRVDAFGLRGASVVPAGDQFVIATLSQTDPETVNSIQELLSKQGRLENVLDGEVIFTGANVLKESGTSQYYGGAGVQGSAQTGYQWQYPFTLDHEGALSFTRAAHNGCDDFGIDCEKTYFFIDRPLNSVLVYPQSVAEDENAMLLEQNTTVSELLFNAQVPSVAVSGGELTDLQLNELQSLKGTHSTALIHPELSESALSYLEREGFKVRVVEGSDNEAWLWTVTRVKSVISLSPGVTNNNVPESELGNNLQQNLVITGSTATAKEAAERRNELRIILKSGSLPVPVDDISKTSISPTLGSSFLQNILLAGVLSLFAVAVFVFWRYRKPFIAIPILLVSFSEVLIILAFASLISWRLDLASMAGIIAAVGTGIDTQIVITDELLRQRRERISTNKKVENAFFIVFASALTGIVAMLPVIIFGLGLGRLTGFAIITITGILAGILISRPAFADIAKKALEKRSDEELN